MLSLTVYLSYEIFSQYKKRVMLAAEIVKIEEMTSKAMIDPRSSPPPPLNDRAPASAPTIIQVSPTDGLRVELQQTTSWNTILQLIFTLLSTYLGLKLINRYVKE